MDKVYSVLTLIFGLKEDSVRVCKEDTLLLFNLLNKLWYNIQGFSGYKRL